jgi:di/tricarboxylate transporter
MLPGLALLLPSAITRNAVLVPAYQEVFTRMGVAPDARIPRALMLFLGVLHPLFSSAFLTGGTSSAPPPAALAAALVGLAALVHLGVTNIAACLALLVPIVATLAQALGLNPIACGLILNMAVDAVIFYPVQTATSLIVYEAGGFTPREVFLLGWVMLALTASVVVFVAIPYWRWWGLSLVVRAQ